MVALVVSVIHARPLHLGGRNPLKIVTLVMPAVGASTAFYRESLRAGTPFGSIGERQRPAPSALKVFTAITVPQNHDRRWVWQSHR